MILWTILRPICKSKWSDAFLPSGERKQKEGEGGQEKVRERPKPHIIKRSEAADMRWDIKPCQELLYPQCKQHFARQLLFFTILPPPIHTPTVNPISQPPLPPSLSYPSTEKMIFSSYLLHFKPTQPFPSTNLSLSTELSKQRLHQSYMILSQLPYVLNHSAMHFCLLK